MSVQQGLRIGIDGTCLALRRGYGRFLRELLPPLLDRHPQHDYVLFIDRHSSHHAADFQISTIEVDTSTAQTSSASAHGNRRIGDLWRMGQTVGRSDLDVMYFPSVYSYYPVPGRMPVAVALHDTIAERYARIVFPSWRTHLLWKLKVFLARRRAQGIITVSEWSRQSIADWFGIPANRIFVTPEAPSAVFGTVDAPDIRYQWLDRHGVPRNATYLVYVGGFNPHKNLSMLIQALAAVRQRMSTIDLRLVLVGDYKGDLFHSTVQALREQIRSLELETAVLFAGFVPDEELRHVYAGATALVLPSLEEGFGLPAVEAAICATPCVATRNSPLPQLLEGGGLFIDPENLEELETALLEIVGNPESQRQLADTALDRARQLNWGRTADATLQALETVVGYSDRR